ncbi:MAG: hypothetical protein QNJ46_26950 [Leptolyngbyaceae cyanobacterium MO_188.B28]|nr:hypothetical protein [Leptolyngbyaceae cyanobacterium MO_188.B28]
MIYPNTIHQTQACDRPEHKLEAIAVQLQTAIAQSIKLKYSIPQILAKAIAFQFQTAIAVQLQTAIAQSIELKYSILQILA